MHNNCFLRALPPVSAAFACVCCSVPATRAECESVDGMRSQVFTFQILDDPEDRAQDVAIRLEQKVCAALAPRM